MDSFYSQNKYSKKKGSYTYYNPECKECTKEKLRVWRKENPEKQFLIDKKRREENPEYFKANRKRFYIENKDHEKEYYIKWTNENKDKLAMYRKNHRNHDITDEEWFACLDYFNRLCAYCGLSEEKQFELYNQQFHKEHVFHDGSNYIDNCVPSCTRCNTSKSDSKFNVWYSNNNEIYSKRRFNKIIRWMTVECFKVLNIS